MTTYWLEEAAPSNAECNRDVINRACGTAARLIDAMDVSDTSLYKDARANEPRPISAGITSGEGPDRLWKPHPLQMIRPHKASVIHRILLVLDSLSQRMLLVQLLKVANPMWEISLAALCNIYSAENIVTYM